MKKPCLIFKQNDVPGTWFYFWYILNETGKFLCNTLKKTLKKKCYTPADKTNIVKEFLPYTFIQKK